MTIDGGGDLRTGIDGVTTRLVRSVCLLPLAADGDSLRRRGEI